MRKNMRYWGHQDAWTRVTLRGLSQALSKIWTRLFKLTESGCTSDTSGMEVLIQTCVGAVLH